MDTPKTGSHNDPNLDGAPDFRTLHHDEYPLQSRYEGTSPQDQPGRIPTEEEDLAQAIENSYEATRGTNSGRPGGAFKSVMRNSQGVDAIQHMMDNLALRVSNEFPSLVDVHGDCLVYIGPPSKLSHHTSQDHEYIQKHFHRILQVHSSQLRAMDSKKFGIGEKQLLGPGACMRAKRRMKKLDVFGGIDIEIQARIKYHLDLRPPSEDDEAVLLLTDLTCLPGVRTWYLAKEKYDIPASMVMGTDELDTASNPYGVLADLPASTAVEAAPSKDLARIQEALRKDLSVSELCPLRQHSAVERLLHAIYGNDPKLDSAPKVWAFYATASYYDCARHVNVHKWIDQWVYAGGNANFVQNNPEVTYRMGMGCGLSRLVRDAFSILVGEKVLLDVMSKLSGTILSSDRSVHGRRFENLDDDERNRISHAASSLERRVQKLYRSLLIDLDWLKDSREYMRLAKAEADFNSQEGGTLSVSATSKIRRFCVGRIESFKSKELRTPFSDIDSDTSRARPFRGGYVPAFKSTYNSFEPEARPFTRSFWMILQRVRFSLGTYSTSNLDVTELRDNEAQLVRDTPCVSRDEILHELTKLNDFMYERHRKDAQAKTAASGPSTGWVNTSPCEGGVLPSPKRSGDAQGAQVAVSTSKRRKTLEYADLDLPFPMELTEEKEEEDHTIPGRFPASENHDSKASAPADEIHSTTLPVRSRWVSQALAWDDPKGPLVGHVAGEAKPLTQMLAVSQSHLASPSVQETVPEGTELSPRTSMPSYQKDIDEHTGMPVYKLDTNTPSSSKPPAEAGASDPSSDSRVLPQPHDIKHLPQTGFDFASMEMRPGNQQRGRLTTPTPKIMQQCSDTEPRLYMSWEDDEEPVIPNTWKSAKSIISSAPAPGYFGLNVLMNELSRVLSRKCDEIVYPPHLFHGAQQTPIDLIDTLVCLDEEEWNFLPLWAGGCDDGEGGVFNEVDVPNDDAAGFRGGKRGIKNGAGLGEEGSVSGSESSFDDIASDAVSTLGKASDVATDGTRTVKSISESGRSDDGFMNQDDIYAVVQAMSVDKMNKGKGKEKVAAAWVPGDEFDFDDDDMAADDDDDDDDEDDGDVSTVMGPGSDIQGKFFGDMDDEGIDEDDTKGKEAQDEHGDDTTHKVVQADDHNNNDDKNDDDDDMDTDMEVIDKNKL